jgi:hypothetical protein
MPRAGEYKIRPYIHFETRLLSSVTPFTNSGGFAFVSAGLKGMFQDFMSTLPPVKFYYPIPYLGLEKS